MKLFKINTEILLLLIFMFTGCGQSGQSLMTELRFLYEDCQNTPIKHSNTIPSNILSITISLKKDSQTAMEKTIQNDGNQTEIIIDNIEPYEKYGLNVRAISKDSTVWSGFAENVAIKPRNKTFVQINLTKELSLTCADYTNDRRFMHSSVKLTDGRILIFGGVNSAERDYDIYHLSSTEKAELFYPYKVEQSDNLNPNAISGTFNMLNSNMISGRIGYVYEILSDGKILIAGGINKADLVKNPDDFFICLNKDSTFIYDIEIFDPKTNTFRAVSKIKTPFAFAQSAKINNKIYIVGGITIGFDCKNITTEGINNNVIVIDTSNLESLKIKEEKNDDASFFAGGKIQLAENKYLFYGGNREDGLILLPDGTIKKISFEISPDFGTMTPQKQYFPYAYPISKGTLFINVSGYYESISDQYYIKYISDDKIQLMPDKLQEEPLFGSSFIISNNYLFQIGGIKSIPFTISDNFIVRKLISNGYEKIDNKKSGVEKLKRGRAFHSSVMIGKDSFLITGGLYFNQANDAIILNLAEIYNGYGLIDQ